MEDCDCGGKMVIFAKTISVIVWKCSRCGEIEETIYPAKYDDWGEDEPA